MIGFGALATALAICGYHVIHVSQRVFAYLMIAALIVFYDRWRHSCLHIPGAAVGACSASRHSLS